MTTPIFIQTTSHVIDVAKITRIDAGGTRARVVIHFVGGTSMSLCHGEAEQLFAEMESLGRAKQIVCVRAREIAA